MNLRVLLVEDEENLREAIKLNLEIEGYEVETADAGKIALKKLREQRFNVVILDVMLPEIDGFQLCETIRLYDSETPILFLTAKFSGEDKVQGLKLGADDYLTKPFNLEELLLRVKNLARRSVSKMNQPDADEFIFGENNRVNFKTFIALGTDNKEYELTKKEIALIKILIDRKGSVVSRKHLLEKVWGYDIQPSTRTIDNFIGNFRKYFEKDPSNPKHFHSVRGVGYRFTEN